MKKCEKCNFVRNDKCKKNSRNAKNVILWEMRNEIIFASQEMTFLAINRNARNARNSCISCIYHARNCKNFSLFMLFSHLLQFFCIYHFCKKYYCYLKNVRNAILRETINAKNAIIFKSRAMPLFAINRSARKVWEKWEIREMQSLSHMLKTNYPRIKLKLQINQHFHWKSVPIFQTIMLQAPNLFNCISLVVDIMMIR